MLHPFLAEEAQLVACSAVIKEIEIQTSDTKTQSSGLSTKINTCTHSHTHTLVHAHRASEFRAAFVKTDSHILTSSDSLSSSGMEKCWKRIFGINKLFIYLFICTTVTSFSTVMDDVSCIWNPTMAGQFHSWYKTSLRCWYYYGQWFKMLMVFEFWFWRQNRMR